MSSPAKTEHTDLPWCIPTGAQNGFIICAGDNPEKPGPILMIVTAPRGRSRVLTDADINANTAFMVKAAQCHADLVKALQAVVDNINEYERVNNLSPNPGRTECWDTVARAKELLAKVSNSTVAREELASE